MIRVDRKELATRLRVLPQYQRLAIEQRLYYGKTTKRAELDKMRTQERQSRTIRAAIVTATLTAVFMVYGIPAICYFFTL